MGNQNNGNHVQIPNDAKDGSPNDKFFIKYVQNSNKKSDPNEVQTVMDNRRIVFVSLRGLCCTWRNVPPDALYTALCIIPLKRKWIMQPTKYYIQLQKSFITQVVQNSDIESAHQFIQLLQWKESQGLVIWVFDYFDCDGTIIENKKEESLPNPYIAAFWYAFSDKLTSLYDHISGQNYKSIPFDEDWWANSCTYVSKYNVKPQIILQELYFLSRNHKQNAIKEIIYQSNPKSLHPMTAYRNEPTNNLKPQLIVCPKDSLRVKGAITPLSPIKERGTASVDSAMVDNKDVKYSYSTCNAQNINGNNTVNHGVNEQKVDI